MIINNRVLSVNVSEFVKDMESYVRTGCGFQISSDYYSISIDPVEEHIEVWRLGEHIGDYDNIAALLASHVVNGKPLVDLLDDFDFA